MNSPCSDYKFDRQDEVGPFLKVFSHWLNPFGNWHEPLAFPYKRLSAWRDTIWCRFIPEWVWWNLRRNPLHNLTHFWLGITPRGQRYEWIDPECVGWKRTMVWEKRGKHYSDQELWAWHKKGSLPRYHYKFWYRGWEGYFGFMSRGNLGAAFRKSS